MHDLWEESSASQQGRQAHIYVFANKRGQREMEAMRKPGAESMMRRSEAIASVSG